MILSSGAFFNIYNGHKRNMGLVCVLFPFLQGFCHVSNFYYNYYLQLNHHEENNYEEILFNLVPEKYAENTKNNWFFLMFSICSWMFAMKLVHSGHT